MTTPREDAIAALREAARAVVDAQPMDWSVPSLHPDHIEVHENAFDALMDAIDTLDRALGAEAETPDDLGQQTVYSTPLGQTITGFVAQEHGYTCGLCEWGRADQPRSLADYVTHMNAEHPVEHAEARAEFKRGEVRAAGALMLGPGHWVDLASPETAEALARALPAVARSLWARSEAGDHQQVWFDEDVLRHFEEYADDTAAAILAAMRETIR